MKISMNPVRRGCYIEWRKGSEILKGEVINHYYTEKAHVFVVRLSNKSIYKTSGKNIYENLINHKLGPDARKEKRFFRKEHRKKKKKLNRYNKSVGHPGKRRLK